MSQARIPRRPASLNPKIAENLIGADDVQKASAIAHASANLLCFRRHPLTELSELDQSIHQLEFTTDEAARFYTLLTQGGIAEVAQTWVEMPETTLPGQLWQLYDLYLQIEKSARLLTETADKENAEMAAALAHVEQLCRDFFSAQRSCENPLKNFTQESVAFLKQKKTLFRPAEQSLKQLLKKLYTCLNDLQVLSGQ